MQYKVHWHNAICCHYGNYVQSANTNGWRLYVQYTKEYLDILIVELLCRHTSDRNCSLALKSAFTDLAETRCEHNTDNLLSGYAEPDRKQLPIYSAVDKDYRRIRTISVHFEFCFCPPIDLQYLLFF